MRRALCDNRATGISHDSSDLRRRCFFLVDSGMDMCPQKGTLTVAAREMFSRGAGVAGEFAQCDAVGYKMSIALYIGFAADGAVDAESLKVSPNSCTWLLILTKSPLILAKPQDMGANSTDTGA